MKRRKETKGVAVLLVLSLLLSLTACNKKNGASDVTDKPDRSGRQEEVVSDKDPYFVVTESEMSLPFDKEKTITYSYVGDFGFVGNYIVASYMVFYEGEEGVVGKAVFDKEGHLAMDLTAQGVGDPRIVKIVEDDHQELCAITSEQAGYSIRKINRDGTLGAQTTLPVDISEETEVLFLQDGNLLIADWGQISIVSSDGKLLVAGRQDEFLGRVYVQDGKNYGGCDHFSPEDWDESYSYIQEIDLNTGEFVGKKIKCTDTSRLDYGSDGNYLRKTDVIQRVDLLDAANDQTIFDWNDTDYDNTYVADARIVSDQEFYFLEKKEVGEEEKAQVLLKLLHAVRAEINPHAGKKIVRVGAVDQDMNIKKYVTKYNLDKNSKCRIEMHNYSLYEVTGHSGLDMNKNLSDKIALDLLSGNGPDILMNTSWLSRFNTGDVLVDLNPLIDANDGTGLDRSAYFDNIFRASEAGGKLYQLPVMFYVSGWAANREVVGEKNSYTYQDFLDVAKALPKDVSVLSENAYSDLLPQFALSEFVDYENKKVHFDDPDFGRLLELVKTYGSARTHEQIAMELQEESNSIPDSYEMFRENMLAFAGEIFSDLSSFSRAAQRLGGKAVFCGIPSSHGGSMEAQVNVSMAISAFSKSQKEAWDFIRFMVAEEQQSALIESVDGLSVSRETVGIQNRKVVELSKKSVEAHSGSDSEHPVEITEETVTAFLEILDNIRLVSSSDPNVMAIVLEEAPGYFTGQRSVEEVCANIQKRAKTIVQERG